MSARERIASRLDALWEIAHGPAGGADRPAFSSAEAAATRLVAGWAADAGLSAGLGGQVKTEEEAAHAAVGHEFNLGSQAPGMSTDVTFKEAGDVQVICAIHPRMKMTVKVTD